MSAVPVYLQMTFQELESLFRSMRNKASWGRVLASLTGRSRSLIDMATAVSERRIRSRHYAGFRTVPVNRIKGSEGRSCDFDRDFNPLHSRTIDRWLNVAIARSSGAVMPPVELIQLGAIYFVRDGHHRISVARALGEEFIDAEVTVLELEPVPAAIPALVFRSFSS